ncbi:DEAD-domain-containing protein [Pleomassaria siparia CBS 279.74]|uniref:RNA helicase n=1 Tax=Pleomassaria siparia CBS 279.74 TaxID=1314801 RepID=A0A6G1KN40_9PLEO|nr:DEAD-domain-containing protein [Pleomassaria siparia CBS 279.74]
MKRKLDENDVPTVAEPTEGSTEATETNKAPEPANFADFHIDARLLRACRDAKWTKPTPVQALAIPLALEGKDILARSSTGTGKTAAYLLPVLHQTIRRVDKSQTSALILVPTRELAQQVFQLAQSLAKHVGQEIRIQNISGKESDVVQRAKLAELPDIVISTPGRASANVNNGALSLKGLAHLIVDEGDLVMGYGFREDMTHISKNVEAGVQLFLMSATLSTELESLRDLFCRDPVLLNLDDIEKNSQHVKQYVISCAEDEKFLLIYAIFLLKLIKGKTIIFVGDVDRSYRVKLFLEQFGVKSAVLNSELPLTSRLHIVEEFNQNKFEILIASDENEVVSSEERPRKKTKTASKPDSGVSRGIDFVNISCVLNFDMPDNYKSYFHRIGRTARAGKSGTAISFVIPKDKFKRHKPTSFPGCASDEEVLAKISKHQKEGQSVEPWNFDVKKLEPFRYRFADALRAVTRIAIREARVKELRRELVTSQKLSRYFEENPESLQYLKHDKALHPAKVQAHLKHVPDYLLPGGRKAEDVGFVNLTRPKSAREMKKRGGGGRKVVRNRAGKIDPLKTFNARGRGKK